MAIKIDTGLVFDTATEISNKNMDLKNAYDDIDNVIAEIRRSWVGSASDNCCQKAEYIKNLYKDNRYEVVEDFVRFLRSQVGESYEKLESTLSSAANAFK